MAEIVKRIAKIMQLTILFYFLLPSLIKLKLISIIINNRIKKKTVLITQIIEGIKTFYN